MSPQKSKLWFSYYTSPQQISLVQHQFGAQFASANEVYLGCKVKAATRSDFEPLIDKVERRLQGWKSLLLSHAGKLQLIKSTIESTLIYYMSTTEIPVSVLSTIQSRIRRFFWGKDQGRYMALLRWDVITRPKMEGGLGLHDLRLMNRALVLKIFWKVASGNCALWVSLMHSKYLPRSSLWKNKRTYRCTRLWKAMMHARSDIRSHVQWLLGNGKKCHVFDEPWFENWWTSDPISPSLRKLTVHQLRTTQGDEWDTIRLTEIMGVEKTNAILRQYAHHNFSLHIEDRLFFTFSQNGVFTVRGAYHLLAANCPQPPPAISPELWAKIWKAKAVTPRVQLFLWRAIHHAIPTGAVMSRRLPRFDSSCPLCGEELESVVHLLFQCPHARAAWFHSVLGIKTDFIPGDQLHHLLMNLWSGLEEHHISYTMLLLWHIWKCRCSTLYAGQKSDPVNTVKAVQAQHHLIQMAHLLSSKHSTNQTLPVPNQVSSGTTVCWVDGSFKEPSDGGVGIVLKNGETLVQYSASYEYAFSPFHMEALALLRGMQTVLLNSIQECLFFTDSAQLVHMLNKGFMPVSEDWRAHLEIMQLWLIMAQHPLFVIYHISRDQNEEAHKLANLARRMQFSISGFTYPIFESL